MKRNDSIVVLTHEPKKIVEQKEESTSRTKENLQLESNLENGISTSSLSTESLIKDNQDKSSRLSSVLKTTIFSQEIANSRKINNLESQLNEMNNSIENKNSIMLIDDKILSAITEQNFASNEINSRKISSIIY
jgi:hypothetical protein